MGAVSCKKVHQGTPILEPEFKGRVLELHQKTDLHGKFSSKRQRGWEAGKSLVAATYREAAGGGGRPNIRLAKGVGRKKGKNKQTNKYHKFTQFSAPHQHPRSSDTGFLNF